MCIAVHRGRVSPLYFFNCRVTDANGRVTDANGRVTDANGRVTDAGRLNGKPRLIMRAISQ